MWFSLILLGADAPCVLVFSRCNLPTSQERRKFVAHLVRLCPCRQRSEDEGERRNRLFSSLSIDYG